MNTETISVMYAREQSGSTRKKYPLGIKLDILYNVSKPDMFIVEEDHSRKIVMAMMVIVGFAMAVLGMFGLLG